MIEKDIYWNAWVWWAEWFAKIKWIEVSASYRCSADWGILLARASQYRAILISLYMAVLLTDSEHFSCSSTSAATPHTTLQQHSVPKSSSRVLKMSDIQTHWSPYPPPTPHHHHTLMIMLMIVLIRSSLIRSKEKSPGSLPSPSSMLWPPFCFGPPKDIYCLVNHFQYIDL